MTAMAAGRFRLGVAAGQVRYQLLLVVRTPMSTFTAAVVPLMVLIALDIATPQVAVRQLHGTRYVDFLIPAMAIFALVNACYVTTITAVVVAREGEVLKRLHGTPLPLCAYVLGRIAAGAVVGVVSVAVVVVVGAAFIDVRPDLQQLLDLTGVVVLGIVVLTTLGLAVSTVVPRPETALPVAYGTMLPVAFVSDVFFPASAAPHWLRTVASDFPLAPIADAAERVFGPGNGATFTNREVLVTLLWIVGAVAVTAARFQWEPGVAFFARRRRWHGRRG